MAVVCSVEVAGGTRADCLALEQRVGVRLERTGGPPEGMMFLCAHPDGDGFRLVMVFRTAEEAHAEVEEHLRGEAAAVGLHLGNPAVLPVWTMALPGARLTQPPATG